ncbi:hypothetical protein [Pseudonocardia alni]|uniref:hypothetical protein n=1 Tax=Pseudonocardia alni TaxID=33907 RepID=UPI003D9F4C6F
MNMHLAGPAITPGLGATAQQMLGIIDIHGFMIAGLLGTMGSLGDRIGRRAGHGHRSVGHDVPGRQRTRPGDRWRTAAGLPVGLGLPDRGPGHALLLVAGPLLVAEYRAPEADPIDLVSVALSLEAIMPVVHGLEEPAVC